WRRTRPRATRPGVRHRDGSVTNDPPGHVREAHVPVSDTVTEARRTIHRDTSARHTSRCQTPSRLAHEVDRDGYAFELEALAQPVLDPVAVVARDEARVVHVHAEARRARGHLRSVEQVQALAVLRG